MAAAERPLRVGVIGVGFGSVVHIPAFQSEGVEVLAVSATREERAADAALAERTGLSRRAVQAAVALLHRRGLLEIDRRGPTETTEYRALRPWRR